MLVIAYRPGTDNGHASGLKAHRHSPPTSDISNLKSEI